MTQRDKVLYELRTGWTACTEGDDEICASIFLRDYMPRYAARILELRQAGFNIRTGRCRKHKTATYELVNPWQKVAGF